jgi:hypothetical protein
MAATQNRAHPLSASPHATSFLKTLLLSPFGRSIRQIYSHFGRAPTTILGAILAGASPNIVMREVILLA